MTTSLKDAAAVPPGKCERGMPVGKAKEKARLRKEGRSEEDAVHSWGGFISTRNSKVYYRLNGKAAEGREAEKEGESGGAGSVLGIAGRIT